LFTYLFTTKTSV